MDADFKPEDRLQTLVLPADVQQKLLVKEEVSEGLSPGVELQDPELLQMKEEQEERWPSLGADQLNVKEETDATWFPVTTILMKIEEDEEKPVFSQLQPKPKDRDLPTCCSADRVKLETDEVVWGGAETCREPNLNTHGVISSSSDTEETEPVFGFPGGPPPSLGGWMCCESEPPPAVRHEHRVGVHRPGSLSGVGGLGGGGLCVVVVWGVVCVGLGVGGGVVVASGHLSSLVIQYDGAAFRVSSASEPSDICAAVSDILLLGFNQDT
ncbi:hypothetical protein CRENBAI_018263 [Crenichthys baileyi]|uniref:Uncharacterized protein n=1 Tax=Crenichthys baileyi TaxID=28760 RepID=A0AAV9S421_9TELE